MNLPEHSHDTPRYVSVNEQRSLRERLHQEGISEEETEQILAELNPSDAPIVMIAEKVRRKFECVSWCGIDNNKLHLPIGFKQHQEPLVFDWNTCLYYIMKR